MKRFLVDANVLLALLVRQHEHHALARSWAEHLAAREAGVCRLVQLTVIRLLGNRTILPHDAISAVSAWKLIDELLQDERFAFLAEPEDLDSIFPTLLKYSIPTGKLVNDAYLASFAISGAYRLVSLDRGFRQFKGLDLELLAR